MLGLGVEDDVVHHLTLSMWVGIQKKSDNDYPSQPLAALQIQMQKTNLSSDR
jgi:hypothetical protein